MPGQCLNRKLTRAANGKGLPRNLYEFSLTFFRVRCSVLSESDVRYSIFLQLASNVSSACWYIWFMFCTYSSNGIRGRLITDKVWLDISPSLTN